MAFIPHLPLDPIDPVQFPRPQAYRRYPFEHINSLKGGELVEILEEYVANGFNARYKIQPLDFTNFTMTELYQHYGLTYYEFKTKGIFFFHHFLAHPQKLNKDMSQKTVDASIDSCIWKRSKGPVGVKRGGEAVGRKTTYLLYDKSVHVGRESKAGYKLVVYRLLREDYGDEPETTELKKSDWGIVRLSRG